MFYRAPLDILTSGLGQGRLRGSEKPPKWWREGKHERKRLWNPDPGSLERSRWSPQGGTRQREASLELDEGWHCSVLWALTPLAVPVASLPWRGKPWRAETLPLGPPALGRPKDELGVGCNPTVLEEGSNWDGEQPSWARGQSWSQCVAHRGH